MAVKARLNDAVRGAEIEIGTFTLDPASIAAGAQGAETVTITGASVGDLIFVSAEALDAGLIPAGAKVTDDDEVTVYLNNHGGSSADGGSKTWNYVLVKVAA